MKGHFFNAKTSSACIKHSTLQTELIEINNINKNNIPLYHVHTIQDYRHYANNHEPVLRSTRTRAWYETEACLLALHKEQASQ